MGGIIAMRSRRFKAGKSMINPANYLEMSAGGPLLDDVRRVLGEVGEMHRGKWGRKISGIEARGRLVLGGEALRTGNRVY